MKYYYNLLKSSKIDEIHRKSMKSNAHQARELRSSLAPCSLLGFRDPTFFLVGIQVDATGCQRPPKLGPLKSMESHEILLKPIKII